MVHLASCETSDRFREWLVAHCLNELKLTPTQVANVSAAYVEDPAAAVREYYLHTPELQWRYPFGLLPIYMFET